MNSKTSSSRFKNFESIIIYNDQFEKCLRIQLSEFVDNVNIRNLLNYLKCNGWVNYKFNEYSIKSQTNDNGINTTLVILGYVPPSLKI